MIEDEQKSLPLLARVKKIITKGDFLRQSLRYLIVGLSSWFLDIALFFVFYEFFGVPLVISNVIAITLSTAYNFVMSRTWTFKPTQSLARCVVLYLLLFVWNQVFSSWALVMLVGLAVPALIGKIITVATITCWNFFLYRWVVFK